MQKEWDGNKVDIFLEDAVNEKYIRRRFNGAMQTLTDEQIAAFAQALGTVNELPISYATVIEEYRYTL
ncbi:MAG: hypothetical protein ACTHVM_03700 [Alkalibacterium gilvum]|uniref:DUF1659 domain-containing protein n=1 Tax=Alkalibacterium gilvum TaxID=1130080 RepID=A0A1H6TF99_9LACT|nr:MULTISPECIES: hypothetical protein [Alkalibacterium]MDN6293267.1 hypothetical protein [Alkalibacterium sp.]MDN6295029.1 hypothetical protein [Alkalibacterium sp.]MDN6397528.1 hypothetical protein [Alkalibacterium sp.]MDN6728743.1 hypothetical protein [Alkalibacterium sp.]SEI78708.1 hypothetical protein SAMN04488113_12018 [Alkalibacterium gilvum]